MTPEDRSLLEMFAAHSQPPHTGVAASELSVEETLLAAQFEAHGLAKRNSAGRWVVTFAGRKALNPVPVPEAPPAPVAAEAAALAAPEAVKPPQPLPEGPVHAEPAPAGEAPTAAQDPDAKACADLRAWRSAQGWSQARAAAQLGVHHQTYAALERGYRPGAQKLLARALSTSSAGSPAQEVPPPTPPEVVGSPAALEPSTDPCNVCGCYYLCRCGDDPGLGTPRVPSGPNRPTPVITGHIPVTVYHRIGRLVVVVDQLGRAAVDVPELEQLRDQAAALLDAAQREVR